MSTDNLLCIQTALDQTLWHLSSFEVGEHLKRKAFTQFGQIQSLWHCWTETDPLGWIRELELQAFYALITVNVFLEMQNTVRACMLAYCLLRLSC